MLARGGNDNTKISFESATRTPAAAVARLRQHRCRNRPPRRFRRAVVAEYCKSGHAIDATAERKRTNPHRLALGGADALRATPRMGLLSGLFGGNKGTILTESPAGKKQDFLEASPYWDQSTVPVNTFKNKSPYTAKVVSCKRIVGPEATGETCHIIFDHKGNMPYWEGQSYGVIPPGTNPKNGKPHTVRLYSIASSRYGDNMAGKTSSLCVRRATYWDPDMGKEDPAKKGVCSNLCGNQPVRRVH